MRIAVLLVLLTGGIALADPAPPDRTPELPEPGARRPNTPESRTCEDIESDARALVARAGSCGSACSLVSLVELAGPDNCVAAFQCTAPVGEGFDAAVFADQARALVAEKRSCGECAQAACMPPAELVGECLDGQCVLTPRRVGP